MVDRILYRLFYFVREALRSVQQNRFIHLVATGTITFSLLTFGIFIVMVINLNQIFDEWGNRIHLIAYLEKNTSAEEIKKVSESITALPQIENVTYVSKEKALNILKESLQEQDGMLEHLEDNPLPASLEIQLKEEFRNPQSLKTTVHKVKKTDKINDVEYGQDWLERFSAFISIIKLVGISIGGVLMLATILIISNTIKLTIYSRKEEIEIMKLVGATNFFIQVPFFFEGLIQGLAGSLLALGILYASYKILIGKIISDYSLYLGASNFVFLPHNQIH